LPGWLHYGVGPRSFGDIYGDERIEDLVRCYQAIPPILQDTLLGVAHSLSSKPTSPTSDPSDST
jgi:hypothetical protein